ncbi:MAG TPA: hypothetical protein PK720_03005 [bacterium]|jgi:hypothetical protein|nr:hypothetical protein [bacterium]
MNNENPEEAFKNLRDRMHAQQHVQEVENLDNLNLMKNDWENIGLVEEDDFMDKKKEVEEKSHY